LPWGSIGSEDGLCGGPFDVIFSNACLQWVAEHTRLLPRLLAQLSPGGVLAVQVPMNYEEPIHRILSGLASDPAWQNKFAQPRRFYTLAPEGYYAVLTAGHAQAELWQTTYFHVMPSHESILDWYRGTGMRPYLEQLSAGDGERFSQQVLDLGAGGLSCAAGRKNPVSVSASVFPCKGISILPKNAKPPPHTTTYVRTVTGLRLRYVRTVRSVVRTYDRTDDETTSTT